MSELTEPLTVGEVLDSSIASELFDGMDDPLAMMAYERLLLVREKRIELAKNHHRNTHGQPMEFELHPHLHDIYETVAPQIVLMGSVQSMKSEFIIIDHFACAAAGCNVFMVLPKVEARGTYVQNRIDRCIDGVPEYKRLLGLGGFSNTAMKHFGAGVIKYVGSNVVSDFKEFPADVMFVEEVDQCNQANLSYGQDRLRASPFQFRRHVGNPTIENFGIDAHFRQSNQKHRFIQCGTCHEWNNLDWYNVIIETIYDTEGIPQDYKLRDQDWRQGRDVRCMCPICGNPFDRFGPGEWIPQNPGSRIDGWLLTMMMSRYNSVTEMWERFQTCMGDPAEMQKFCNSDLGIPFSDFDARMTEETMNKAAQIENYRLTAGDNCAHIPGNSSRKPCSMGVDVGKFFDVRISQVEEDGTRRMMFVGKVRDRHELVALGLRYNVEVAVIDSMPEAKVSQDFQDSAPFYVWLARYGGEGSDARMKRDKKQRTLSVDRTSILDRTLADVKSGNNILPRNFRSLLGGEYVAEMIASVRQSVVDTSGNTRYIWSKCKDHSRHADVYDFLASTMMASFVDVLDGISVG